MDTLVGQVLVRGDARAELVYSEMALSFWGGIDPFTGEVIDRHHPLSGRFIDGKVLAIPSGRGSCTGSSVMLELILNGHAPAALVLAEPDEILFLGVLVAKIMFGKAFPVVCLGQADYAALADVKAVSIHGGYVTLLPTTPVEYWSRADDDDDCGDGESEIALSDSDTALLRGDHGKAAQTAMQLVLKMAALQGAKSLIDISQAHIDGCIYTGPASLRFAEQLVEWGAKVRVPTTLNSISVDKRQWRELGVDAALGEPASALGDAYLNMGARVSFTCAPYLLESRPRMGEQIVWAESNAVLYANSVLGARTLKYPDYLDICVAIIGRAPFVGTHADAGRKATIRIDVCKPTGADDAFYPVLGYAVGLLAKTDIPVITGLEKAEPQPDDLKAFSAAFATTSAAPLFHIVGVTPEAPTIEQALGEQPPKRVLRIGQEGLRAAWRELDSSPEQAVQLVSLGNPHFSLTECEQLAGLCAGRRKHADTALVVTMGREINERARIAGYVATLEQFGATLITDTCWCMLGEPVIPPRTSTLMTNSGKYAHYAPGLVGRKVRFGNLAGCVQAACDGEWRTGLPDWLR